MKERMEKKGIEKRYVKRGLLAVILLVCSVFTFQYAAKADGHLLESYGSSLFIGDTLTVSDYFDEEELEDVQEDSIAYRISEESGNSSCITLDASGNVTAVKAGTAYIDISYLSSGSQTPYAESFSVTVLEPEQITAGYGKMVWPTVFNMYNPYTGSNQQDGKKYSYSFSNDSAVLDKNEDGVVIEGFTSSTLYLEKADKKIAVAQITVKTPSFAQEKLARAAGTDAFYPAISNYTSGSDSYYDDEDDVIELDAPVWSVEDESILSVTDKGFAANKTGTTTVKAGFTAKNGDTLELKLQVTVTDPKFTKKVLVVAENSSKALPLTGTCSFSSFEAADTDTKEEEDDWYEDDWYEDEDASEAGNIEFKYSYLTASNKVYGDMEGTEEVTILIDGRALTITIIVTDPRYSDNTFTLYKGLKKTIPLSGIDKTYSTITYTSANTSIATVTKKGKVTAKKVGTVKIKIKADGRTIPVWVEICTKKAYQAAKKEIAISKTKTHYSQTKRMSKGYYDCSSIVSRVYRQYGVYFGSKSGWSPTAAAIGQWCANNNKVLYKKGVSYTKLVPGDLIFYSYEKNGRYRNISHVEMYVGNGMSVSASSSNNKVIYYGYSEYAVVLIARPTK